MSAEAPYRPDLVITNASEVVIVSEGADPRRGPASHLKTISNGALAVKDGKIIDIAPTTEIQNKLDGWGHATLDAAGRSVVPGFVDAHSHPVYVGNRDNEYLQRLDGTTYLEISKAGGGIHETWRRSSSASAETLEDSLGERLSAYLAGGTTTAEAKTGYWWSADGERRAVDVINRVSAAQAVDLVPTLLGANTVPKDIPADRYVDLVIDEMIPAVRASARFCDVVCDIGQFTVAQSRRILKAALEAGLGIKVHADEFADVGAAVLAAELQAVSADHLCYSSSDAMDALAEAGTIGVVLPTTKLYLLAPRFADARALLERGVPIALGTDHGPSNPITSMPYVITASCHHLGLTPAEALIAATWNAAFAVGKSDEVGKLAIGHAADVVVLDMPSYRFLPYFVDRPPVWAVVKRGQIVKHPRVRDE